jgi:uncharacterized protein YbbC (DUF1343 family)
MLGIPELLEAEGPAGGGHLTRPASRPSCANSGDVLHERAALAALFGPEHGVRGDVQYLEEVGEARDARTGAPEHSLYGKDFGSLTPREEHLRGLDALVFDVQDAGSRYYTYLATMSLAMQAAARQKLRFLVLDRPNPIGGLTVEGGSPERVRVLRRLRPVCARHGLTAGIRPLSVNRNHPATCG